MNTVNFKEGQTYICTKSNNKVRWTEGKEYKVFLASNNEPAIKDNDGYKWSLRSLNSSKNQFKLKEEQPKVTLDEPQKPVVPKFVADYIEEYRGKEATLYEMMDNSEDEVYTWLFGNPRIETENERQLLFAQAYAVGYEVEKEPVWAIKNDQGNYLTKCDLWGKDGVNYSFECNPSDKLLFTDKLIADAAALLVNGTAEQEQA